MRQLEGAGDALSLLEQRSSGFCPHRSPTSQGPDQAHAEGSIFSFPPPVWNSPGWQIRRRAGPPGFYHQPDA